MQISYTILLRSM